MEKINSSSYSPTESSSSGAQLNKCGKCDKILKSKFSLKDHYERVHIHRDPIKCPHCKIQSKNYPSLKFHIQTYHRNSGSRLLVPCPKCQKEVQKRCLKIHLKSHEERRGCVCEICGQIYKLKGSYIYHKKIAHSESSANNFPCQTCGKIFSQVGLWKKHQETHSHLRKKIPCHLCSKSIYPDCYNSHVRTCSGSGEKGCICYFCHKEFNTITNLREHLKGSHIKEKALSCQKCKYKTSRAPDLIKHEKVKHTKNGYTCYFCGFQSLHEISISGHMMAKHTKEKSYKCEFCPKRFPTYSGLRGHMRRGGPTKEDKKKHGLFHTTVECWKCFKVIERTTLTEHLKRHDEPKYKCTLCTKVFSSIKSRWEHNNKKHDSSKKKAKFECEICGRFLSCKKSLVEHKRTHNTGRTKVTCPLCEARLLPECYNTHISMVHGPPKFHCYFCGNRFTSSPALSAHLLGKHIKEKSMKCNICPNFRTCHPNSLRYHVRTHQGGGKKKDYFCYFCNGRHRNRSGFLDHVTSHLLEKRWTCNKEMCRKRFVLRGELTKHNAVVHKGL